MTRGVKVGGAVALLVAVAAVVGACTSAEPEDGKLPPDAAKQAPEVVKPVAPAVYRSAPLEAYAGSQACARCHEKAFDGWHATVHPKQERLADASTVVGDFEKGEMLDLDGIPARPFREGTTYFIESSDNEGTLRKYPIVRVVGGSMYKQRYVTRLPSGADAVLPLEWNMREKRFQPYHANSGYKPGQAEFWGGPSRAWAYRCAGCHVVGLQLTLPSEKGGWPEARYKELGVGCESCHGAGAAHVAAPAATNIVNPGKLPPERVFAICAQCHARGLVDVSRPDAPLIIDFPITFKPGDHDIHRFTEFTRPLEGLSSWGYWANKQSKQHHQQGNDFERSAHYQRAGMSCISCHMSHERPRYGMLRKDPRDNTLCLDCHTERAAPEKLEAHTHHPAASSGSVCIECHMPKVVQHANPLELRAHTQWHLNPQIEADLHVPEACTLCHKDRERQWAADTVNEWKFGKK